MGTGRRVRPRMIAAVVVAVMVGLVVANAASAASSDTSASTGASSSDLSTDFRMGYVDDIDFQANIFASYNSTPYFMFTEVYDLLLNYNVPTGAPDLKNSPATSTRCPRTGSRSPTGCTRT